MPLRHVQETVQTKKDFMESQNKPTVLPAMEANEIKQMLQAAAQTPTAEEVEYQEMEERCLISTNKVYPPKEYILTVKGIPTLSVGDIHMIQAQAKQGKTSLVTIFVAAIIAGMWGYVAYALHRLPKVIVFDTEQFECDTYRQYQAIMSQGGMAEENLSRLRIYNLRGMDYEERRKFIRMAILKEKPLLVVIDGLRDLVPDINDSVFCPTFVQELMQMATDAKCAILGVLHNNPGEGKARGWLGTEYINKCGYSFEPHKEDGIVTVKNTIYRGAPVADWRFTFADNGSPIVDDKFIAHLAQIENEKRMLEAQKEKEAKEAEHLGIVLEELKANNGLLSRADLVKVIVERKVEGFGRQKAYDLIKAHLELPDPLFREVNGKMLLVEKYEQAEIQITD